MQDIRWVVGQSPYIPLGHHEFFCIGLMAGIQGRFLEALHVLVPQMENLLRYWLSDSVATSSLDQNGFQREYDLKKLLDIPETTELLDENIVTVLKMLFVHQAGPNLRNELCHGMLNSNQLFTPFAVYAWWIAIWLPLNHVAWTIRNGQTTAD